MKFKIILVTIKKDLCDEVIEVAKKAGATGATIIPARGSGMRDSPSFLGMKLENLNDLVLFLVEEHAADDILNAVKETAKFDQPGMGMAFVLSVDKVVGIESQIERFKEVARDQYY
jgi:nitrogen regulatory protein P-II 1